MHPAFARVSDVSVFMYLVAEQLCICVSDVSVSCIVSESDKGKSREDSLK